MRRTAVALLALAALAGCSGGGAPARAQWTVYLATDAPVPQLGQQLLVELIDESGNDVSPDEARLLDGSRPGLWPVSFGIVPSSPAQSPRLRARLYRLDEAGDDGSPQGTALLDATGTLPPVGSGSSPVSMTLAMSCFGVAPDLSGRRTCDPATGALAPEPTLPLLPDPSSLPAAGSWPPAATVPCSAQPASSMTCIPGGVFLIGAAHAFSQGPDLQPSPQHLVQLGAFAIDDAETTVGEYRQLVQSNGLAPPSAVSSECTYAVGDDDLPVNCVSWAQAEAACEVQHKRLPREAEWEYVAGNVGLRTPFPWGTDTDICAYAVVARGDSLSGDPTECLSAEGAYSSGPTDTGTSKDVTVLGVHDLGGNVSEWMADLFEPYTGPCWSGASLLTNPVCSSGGGVHALRGGSWRANAASTYAYERDFPSSDSAVVDTGFRCAVSM